MLSERLLTQVMRLASSRYLSFGPLEGPALPLPRKGGKYLLYAHVPFCESLCPYCSFNRFPFEENRARAYFRSLREEMRKVADLGYDFGSLYVGGGTPTILVDELCATIDLARERFHIQEVSTETNPNHLVPRIIEPLAERVDRFSVGVQSFDDSILKLMGRYDSYGSGEEIRKRLRAVEGRFHSLNVDLMFNFPTQTREMLVRDIDWLKETRANQTTFYPLMASPSVAHTLAQTIGRVDYAREASYYQEIAGALADAFEPASAWTFSRKADAMIDEYIVNYDEYVGIGSGAFSYVDGTLFVNTFSLQDYGQSMAQRRFALTGKRRYSHSARMRYRLMMGLFGLSLDKRAFERDFGRTPERGLPVETTYLRAMGAFATNNRDEFKLSERGRYLLVSMMREFFVGVNEVRDQARAALSRDERNLLFAQVQAPEAYADAKPSTLSRDFGWNRIGYMGDTI
jgi:coproporphyrinogen III oxidase-like Fe-S oxidoreductase